MTGIKDQFFGMELEFAGITRESACKAIAATIGGTAPYFKGGVYATWMTKDTQGRSWNIQRDGSIDTSRGGESCEFVTPKCSYDDIPTVQECIRALRKAGAKVNASCGLHIHIDGSKHDAKSIKNLIFTMNAKQELIYKAVGTQRRRLGRWCLPVDAPLVDAFKSIKKLDDGEAKKTWYSVYNDSYRTPRDHYHASRYHALNLHSFWYRGTVEFRCFEATLHAGEIRAYINLCLAMSAQAINAKRASAEPLDNGNDKYAMRCWLLRLGFIGDEWKTVREHLLKRLEGNAAWRNAPETYESYNRQHNSQIA